MTKGLHICRHLHKAGWRVVLVDYDRWWMQGSRLSSCCAAFHSVPDLEQDPLGASLSQPAVQSIKQAVHLPNIARQQK